MKNIIYATLSSESTSVRNSIVSALESVARIQDVQFHTEVSDERVELQTQVNRYVEQAYPDAIVISHSGDIAPDALNAGVPVFDLSTMFDDAKFDASKPRFWIGRGVVGQHGIGIGRTTQDVMSFFVDGDGNIVGLDSRWRSIEDALNWLDDLLGTQKGPPIGSPDDMYAGARDAHDTWILATCAVLAAKTGPWAPAVGLACYKLAPIVIEKALDWVTVETKQTEPGPAGPKDAGVPAGVPFQSDTEDQEQETEEKNGDSKTEAEEKKDAGPAISEEGDGVSGQAFLLLLIEWASKHESDRIWKGIKDGTYPPPEETDVWQEYVAWLGRVFEIKGLRDNGFGDMLLTEEDETGYTFLYNLFRRADGLWKENKFDVMEWWWRKGAPIDPIDDVSSVVELTLRNMISEPYVVAKFEPSGEIGLEFFIR